ncbi:MAG: twin-arginine translocase TatA/TatE family subunit [Candidatus Sericytochromatia bacterium]
MFGIGLPELSIVLVIALVIFGPGKLPEVGRALGKSIGEFRKESKSLVNDIKDVTEK